MKKQFILLTFFSLSLLFTVKAQDKYDDLVKVGNELIIGKPSKSNYQYINIPRKNFIIKKGGILKMSSIMNKPVIVTRMVYDKNSSAQITFKLRDGGKFFNAYRTLSADLNGAIRNGELRLKQTSQRREMTK